MLLVSTYECLTRMYPWILRGVSVLETIILKSNSFNLDWTLFHLFPQPSMERYWVTRMWGPFKWTQAVHKVGTPHVSIWPPFLNVNYKTTPRVSFRKGGGICSPHPWNSLQVITCGSYVGPFIDSTWKGDLRTREVRAGKGEGGVPPHSTEFLPQMLFSPAEIWKLGCHICHNSWCRVES